MTLRLLAALLFLASSTASAEVLFEAFYRIEKNGKHTGYMIQRLSQAASNKTLVTYLHTVVEGDAFYETTRSIADSKTLKPIESLNGGNSTGMRRTLAAYFKPGKAWVETRLPGSKNASNKEWLDPKRVPMQDAFVFYAADLPLLKKGKNYAFEFYSERAGRAAYGQLSLEGEQQGVQQIVLDILGEPQENFVTMSGDPLGARSPATGTVAYWVKTRKDAVGHLEYPSKDMITLFGDLPEGKKNPWFARAGFDARSVVNGFPKSFGTRKLAQKEREKITVPLPVRKGLL
jgi:hypothetical protein